MRRREYLLLTVAGIGGLAGCSELQETNRIVIDSFAVTNESGAAKDVHVLLLDGGDPVYWRTVAVDAFDEDAGKRSGEILDDYPGDSGQYVVHARLDDGKRASFDLTSFEVDCTSLRVHVGREGHLSIFWSIDCAHDR